MLHAIVITIIILIILKLEFIIKFHAFLDVYGNNGKVYLYLFFIRVYKAEIRYRPNSESAANVEIHHGKNLQQIHLNNDIKDEKSISRLRIIHLFSNLNIVEIMFNANVGGGNALNTAVLMGTIKIMFYSLISALRSRQTFVVNERLTPVFHAQVMRVEAGGIFNISIADIIYGFAIHMKEKNKRTEREVAR